MKNCAALLVIVGVWTHVNYNPGYALVEDSFSLLTMVTKKQKFEQIWRTYLIFSLKIRVSSGIFLKNTQALLEPFLNPDFDWQRFTVQ